MQSVLNMVVADVKTLVEVDIEMPAGGTRSVYVVNDPLPSRAVEKDVESLAATFARGRPSHSMCVS